MENLIKIQSELKAPKNQKNSFGNYMYRSCEDILEAVKPLLQKYNCALLLTDAVEQIGNRIYVKATASIMNEKTTFSVTAYARESETKKGMDEAQITGACSSYARKYALNGLFLIDDTKDADFTNKGEEKPVQTLTAEQLKEKAILLERVKKLTNEQITDANRKGLLDRINGVSFIENKTAILTYIVKCEGTK